MKPQLYNKILKNVEINKKNMRRYKKKPSRVSFYVFDFYYFFVQSTKNRVKVKKDNKFVKFNKKRRQ